MKTIALYLAVIATAALTAWAVFGWRGEEGAKDTDTSGGGEALTSALDPLWYRDVSQEEKLGSARFRLLRMSSSVVAANQAGNVKDEIALLCHDEAVVDQIISAFEEIPPRAPARVSAFMEIFARVRHPRFADLFVRAINHEDYEPKANALEAARIQATPKALPLLAAALSDADASEQTRIIRALQAIDSAEGFDLIRRNLGRLERDALILGLPLLAESNYRGARPGIERLMDHEDVDVQVIASYAAARLGRTSALDRLAGHARNRGRTDGSRAQALQLFARAAPRRRADDLDRELLEDEVALVRVEALSGLVFRRDAAALEQARTGLQNADANVRSGCMIALARSGRDEDIEALRSEIARFGPHEIKVLCTSLGIGRAPTAVTLLGELARRGDDTRGIALRALPAQGQRALPLLAELFRAADEARDEEKLADVARTIAAIPCEKAREILLAWSPFGSKRLRIYIRSGVRRIDQELIAGHVAPLDRGLE